MSASGRMVPVEEVPTDTTMVVTLRESDTGEEREAILTRIDGDVVGWLNHCQHFRHIRLDKGSGATMRNGEIVCTNHGAMFEADTGECTFGPCEGAFLDGVSVAVRDGAVYLTDADYEFVEVGATEEEAFDLGSESNLEF